MVFVFRHSFVIRHSDFVIHALFHNLLKLRHDKYNLHYRLLPDTITPMKMRSVFFCCLMVLLPACLSGRLREPKFTVWATGDSLKVAPHDPYQEQNHHWDGATSTISIKGAANEWVALQLIIRADRAAEGVGVEFSDLKSGTDLISRNAIRLYRERYVRVTTPTDRNGSTGKGSYPDPLIPFYNPYPDKARELALPLSLAPDENCPVWVDIFIPPGASAGLYTGTIRITRHDRTVKELTLRVTVWNFSLPDRKKLKVFFDLYAYRWTRGEGIPFALCDEAWVVLSRYEIMAHEHGFSNGHWGLMPENITATEGVDWGRYDAYLGTVLDGSLFADGASPACWELPFPENWNPGNDVLENYCREVVRHWEEKGWDLDSAFAYVWDERGPTDETVIRYGKILREDIGREDQLFLYERPSSGPLWGGRLVGAAGVAI